MQQIKVQTILSDGSNNVNKQQQQQTKTNQKMKKRSYDIDEKN